MQAFRSRLARLVAPCALAAAMSHPGAADAQEKLAMLMTRGEPVFNDICAACHGHDGKGSSNAPQLRGSAIVASRTAIIYQILAGNPDHGMPAFGEMLSDEEIAAVATYVRNSWNHDYGPVYARSVEMRR